jgi:hypothetical protein
MAGQPRYPGDAVAQGKKFVDVRSDLSYAPAAIQWKHQQIDTYQNQGLVAAGPPVARAAVLEAGVVAPAAVVVPRENPAGYVWGIAILGLFIFIFCVTIIILLFVISLENNRIASSILAGLSAIFAVIMVGLMFRYDRLVGNYATDTVVEEEPVVAAPMVAVAASAPAPVVAQPAYVSPAYVAAAPVAVGVATPVAAVGVAAPVAVPVAVAAPMPPPNAPPPEQIEGAPPGGPSTAPGSGGYGYGYGGGYGYNGGHGYGAAYGGNAYYGNRRNYGYEY